MKKFDLNIEKILENWDLSHAVREIIANAIDEQKLTNSSEIRIYKDELGKWHIRDFGRGIRYDHFTQKENDEKLNGQGIIGKFGIGLKDALATFERKGVNVKIISKHGTITLGKSVKSGFDDLITLHAYISEPLDTNFIGSDVVLSKIEDSDIEKAKNLFLKFNNEVAIESTKFGEILKKSDSFSSIYINGVQVAKEDNFLFSYNITQLNSALRKAINRERSNVGRSAYTSIVKAILLACVTRDVAMLLSEDLKNFSYGNTHDELKWIDVQQHAASILNKSDKVVFVTPEEIERGTDLVNEAREGGFEVVTIPSNLRDKLHERNQLEQERNPGNTDNLIRTFTHFQEERSDNFEFKFISPHELDYSEREVWNILNEVLNIIGGKPYNVKEISISETMERDSYTFRAAAGLWRPQEKQIIIKRDILKQGKARFIAVLLHEIAHAISGATDATRSFETELTRLLGVVGAKAISS